MRVAGLVLAVGDDDLGALPADDGDEPLDRLVEGGLGEGGRVLVGLGVGHARVPVAQEHRVVVADDLGGGLQLGHPDPADVGPHLGCVHGRVEDVALLAPGAATNTVCTPSAWYLATVGAPLEASSSGCAWTLRRHRRSGTSRG